MDNSLEIRKKKELPNVHLQIVMFSSLFSFVTEGVKGSLDFRTAGGPHQKRRSWSIFYTLNYSFN